MYIYIYIHVYIYIYIYKSAKKLSLRLAARRPGPYS